MTHPGVVACLTIVVESVLEQRLVDGLARCGARGWTITAARGHGPGHTGMTEVEGGSSRIEVLASPEVAARIWDLMRTDFFPHYSMAAWEYPVTVARIERYVGGTGSTG